MKKYLYVDTENTGLSFIDLVSRMGKSWTVTIFYSDQSPKLSFAEMDLLINSRCKCRFVSCRNGRPNAMDFCIMTQLGMAVEKHPDGMHLILSRDKGYLAGIDLLREKGCYVGEIVLDELTRSISWVSTADDSRPYSKVRDFLDSLFALEQLPAGALPAGALPAGTEGGTPLLMEHAGGARRSRRGGRGRRGGARESITAPALERALVKILIDRFDAVGVDRRKKQMGQILRRGLNAAYQNGEFHFDRMEPQLRKFAMFREGDERLLELLTALSEVNGLLVTGTEHFYGDPAQAPLQGDAGTASGAAAGAEAKKQESPGGAALHSEWSFVDDADDAAEEEIEGLYGDGDADDDDDDYLVFGGKVGDAENDGDDDGDDVDEEDLPFK